jgi:hypothetical protein
MAPLVQIRIEPEVATEILKSPAFPQAKMLIYNSLCRSLDNPVWTAALNWQKADAALWETFFDQSTHFKGLRLQTERGKKGKGTKGGGKRKKDENKRNMAAYREGRERGRKDYTFSAEQGNSRKIRKSNTKITNKRQQEIRRNAMNSRLNIVHKTQVW